MSRSEKNKQFTDKVLVRFLNEIYVGKIKPAEVKHKSKYLLLLFTDYALEIHIGLNHNSEPSISYLIDSRTKKVLIVVEDKIASVLMKRFN